MSRTCLLRMLVILSLVAPNSARPVSAAPTTEQRKQISQIDGMIAKAGNLSRGKKYEEAVELIKQAQANLEKVAASAGRDLLPLLDDSHRKLERVHSALELEGYELPQLKKPSEMIGAKPDSGGGVPAGAASFVKHVAPILVSKCGRCHVNDAKGMFSMSSFASLMKGPQAGKVIFPGDAAGSRLVEVVESGDMPRGGLKVTGDELAVLKKWITEGAKFDGGSDQDTLTSLVPDAKPAEAPALQVTRSAGGETVSFANEIAGVLARQCASCHGTMRPRENFSLATFQGLLKGGDGGPVIVPGNPDESLLVKKLKGTGGGQRMPQGRPPLEDALIAKIETWIREGATFDARDASMSLLRVSSLAKAMRSSHDELATDRTQLADENWKLAMPSVAATRHATRNSLLLGNVGPNSLEFVGETVEAVAPRVAEIFRADADSPLIKGRTTLFVFAQRYDYTEFGQMVEKRELPKEWRGHWQFDVLDSYGALILPRDKNEPLTALLAYQLGANYIASLGDVPHWFAEGCGRWAAAKIDGTDKRVLAINDAVPQAVDACAKPDDFINRKLPTELNDVASYSFVSFLATEPRAFERLLDTLRKSSDFEKSFAGVYKATPNQLAEVWIKRPAAVRTKTKGPAKKS